MTRVALKGLAGRKLRSLLTAIAIVLGIAMVSGTFVLTDTIENGFDTIFSESYAGSDAVITGRGDDDAFPESVLSEVRGLPQVVAAEGAIDDEASLVDRNGGIIGSGEASLAFSVDPASAQFNPLTLVDGDWPSGRGEIAIDRATAEKKQFGVGDTIRVVTRGPARAFEIVGIAEFGSVSSIGGATMAIFDVRTAQALFDKQGKLDEIRVAARPGVSTAELLAEIRPLLPPAAQVRSSAAEADEAARETSEGLGIIRYALLAFGGIALFVGAFVIANTLSITIAQRVRELATVRTLGGSRRQVLGSVILEAFVVGVIASFVGLLLGLGLAKGLNELFVAAGIDLPQGETVFSTRTVVVSMLAGVLVTLIASLRPAWRATRVAPIAAVREGSVLPPSRLARFGPATALTMLAAAVGLLAYGLFADGLAVGTRLLALGTGVVLIFLGVTFVAPRLVRPLAWALGWPGARLGGAAGSLARENARRNPARIASTASALMIGLALVTFVAMFAQGVRKPFEDAVDELFVADYALTGEQTFEPLPPEAGEAAGRAAAVEVVAGVREGHGQAFGKDVSVTGVDRNAAKVLRFDWTSGSNGVPGHLGRDGAIVMEQYAEDHGLALDSPLTIETPTGEALHLRVEGIFAEPPGGSPFGDVTVSTQTFDASYRHPTNAMTFINTRGGVTESNSAQLEKALEQFPDVKVVTASQFKKDAMKPLNRVLSLLYVLLGLSVLVSAFGIVNTLVLTVFERTREIGMLRAVGMTRRQVRRMVRLESVGTALIGATLGIAVGVFLAALVSQALRDEGVVFAVPYASIGLFVVTAIAVGLAAAVLPARRASRLNVLHALQYE